MTNLPSPLIDVLSEDSFSAEHLPGAVNLCVYEMAFVDKVRAAFPDPATSLTVYGYDDTTREAATAITRLQAAGYHHVVALAGGLAGWKASGGAVEKSSTHTAAVTTGRFVVDPEASFVHWIGRNLFNSHTGSARLRTGELLLQEGRVLQGRFVVDLTSLTCADLTDSAYNAMLIAHLKSDDFFSVDRYPDAEFQNTSADPIAGATTGLPNYHFHGNLTLRGDTHPIDFLAVVAPRPEGGFIAQALIDLDRTRWGSIYGSGKFFARLGQHVVNDLVHLHLKVVTTKAVD